MFHLGLKFSATECNGWPSIHIYIDDDHYETYRFTGSSARLNIPLDLLDGDHELEIELFGKTDKNTQMSNGKIIQDQLLTIEDIYVDDIKIGDFLKYRGKYFDVPEGRQALTFGVNASWKLEFKTPMVSWVIEEQNQITEEKYGSDQRNTYSKKKDDAILEVLDRIEKKLNDLDI